MRVIDTLMVFGNIVAFILLLSFSLFVINLIKNIQKDNVHGNIIYIVLLYSLIMVSFLLIEIIDGIMIITGSISTGFLSYISLFLVILSLSIMVFIYDEWFNKGSDGYTMSYYPLLMIIISVILISTIVHSYDSYYNGIGIVSIALIMLLCISTHILFSIKCIAKSKNAVKGLLKWRLRFLSISSIFYTIWITILVLSMFIFIGPITYMLSYISITFLISSIIFLWFGWITPNRIKKYVRWK